MRSFMAFLAHETNSFSPIATTLANFDECGIYRPEMGAPEQHLPLLKGVADFYEQAQQHNHQAVVGTCALAQPSAPCRQTDYETLRDEILAQLSQTNDVDMVLLMMHGAMMSQHCDDCEGDMLQRVRAIVGEQVAIGVLLDLHCNITQPMLDNADILIPCKEYPHTDFALRAAELYRLTWQVVEKKITPVHSFFRVPVLGLFQTLRSPMKDFIQKMIRAEAEADILSVGLAHGFPWADFPDAGAGVVVTSNNKKQLAQDLAKRLGHQFFNIRQSAQTQTLSLSDLVRTLRSPSKGTIVVADMADNPGGGAAADSTFILAALLSANIRNALLGLFWDPDNVKLAFAAGEGSSIDMRLGGKTSAFSGEAIDLQVTVKQLRHNAQQPHIADGYPVALGNTALVESNGVSIVLNDIRQQPFHPDAFTSAGINPWSQKIVVVKSSFHFIAGFGEKAEQVLYVDTPGSLSSDAKQRPYKRLTRPVWPLDCIEL